MFSNSKKGDTYDVVRGDLGAISRTAYNAFCGLMEDIVMQINTIANQPDAEPEDDDDLTESTETDQLLANGGFAGLGVSGH
jgi:hypothetical protein